MSSISRLPFLVQRAPPELPFRHDFGESAIKADIRSSAPIAGVQRVITMKIALTGYDLTWELSCAYVWTCAEPMVGIICACLPTYAILFRRMQSAYRARKYRMGSTTDLESRSNRGQKLYDSAYTLGTPGTWSSER